MKHRPAVLAQGLAARGTQPRQLALGLLAIILAGVGLAGWQLYYQVSRVQADLHEIKAFVQAQPSLRALPTLGAPLARLHADTLELRATAAPWLPLARRLSWVPSYGPQLASAEPLLDILADLATAADAACSALCSITVAQGGAELSGTTLTHQLVTARPKLELARAALDRAQSAQASLQSDALPPGLRGELAAALAYLPQLRDGLDLALAAPELLGAQGARSYLLLAQDINELRATGGFIGGVGVLTIENGTITSLTLGDSYDVDRSDGHARPAPPEPLRRYLGLQLWLFRDANWTPDFPTAARQAIDFYHQAQGRDIDGVIAFDESLVRLLLSVTGPVEVAGATVSADNVVGYMHEQYSRSFPIGRKTFMQPLGRAIVAKAQSHVNELDWHALGQVLRRAFEQRHLQAYSAQPKLAALLARQHWDGALQAGRGDFLMLVDSNLGYNKVNPRIVETASYTLDLRDLHAPAAQLNVRHTNRQPQAPDCNWKKRSHVVRYEDYFVGCYWDFLRVLVPADSRLLGADTHATPGAWLFSGIDEDERASLSPADGGAYAFNTFLVVPMGETRDTVFRYRLPPSIVEQDGASWHYRLVLQRQAGNEGLSVAVHIRLPHAARLIAASATPEARDDQSVDFLFRLDHDQQLDLFFGTL